MASWNTAKTHARAFEQQVDPDGAGDGGAHVDMLCDAGYPTYLLGTWVREKEAITLEEGVRKLTSIRPTCRAKDRAACEGRAGRRGDLDPAASARTTMVSAA